MNQHLDLASAPVSATIRLQFLDYRIDIRSNSLRLASKVQSYFSEYLAPDGFAPASAFLDAISGETHYDPSRLQVWSRASSPNRRPKESYYDDAGVRYILKNRTGVLITLAGPHAAIVGELESNANQVVNLVGTLFGLSLLREGYVMFHASAVVKTGTDEALIFLGNSGSGKSSVALQLIEHGAFEYVSNDRVLLRPGEGGVQLVGLPKKPRVNPGTLLASRRLAQLVPRPKRRAYERLPASELWTLEDKHDVDVRDAFGVRTRLAAKLKQVYSLEWRQSGTGLAVDQLDAEGALAAMRLTAKDFGPYETEPTSAADGGALARIAASVPFTAVAGKTAPHDFAAALVSQSA